MSSVDNRIAEPEYGLNRRRSRSHFPVIIPVGDSHPDDRLFIIGPSELKAIRAGTAKQLDCRDEP